MFFASFILIVSRKFAQAPFCAFAFSSFPRTDKQENSENLNCRTMSENGSVDEIKVEEINNEAAQTAESGELSEGKK